MENAKQQIRISSLSHGGEGVGRLADGHVVFVEQAAPGDLVTLTDIRIIKRLARARIDRLLEAGPGRVEPRCQHFGACGGCAWQHIDYAAQLHAKRALVRDALARIGHLQWPDDIEVTPSPDAYGYRSRARLLESGGRLGYRRRSSNDPIAIDSCPILVGAAQAALDEHQAFGLATQRRPTIGGRELHNRPPQSHPPQEWQILVGSDAKTLLAPSATTDAGAESVTITLPGLKLRASFNSFVQGNALLWETLANAVLDQCLAAPADERSVLAHPAPPPRFLELFAGIGFLTLPLLQAGCSGVAMESSPDAVRDLKHNLQQAGYTDRLEVHQGLVERRQDWSRLFADTHLLLMDPPRSGLNKSLCKTIATTGPARVVYLSCDPATLARDLKLLCAADYKLAHVSALDLFPQTPHVETLVRLERS